MDRQAVSAMRLCSVAMLSADISPRVLCVTRVCRRLVRALLCQRRYPTSTYSPNVPAMFFAGHPARWATQNVHVSQVPLTVRDSPCAACPRIMHVQDLIANDGLYRIRVATDDSSSHHVVAAIPAVRSVWCPSINFFFVHRFNSVRLLSFLASG